MDYVATLVADAPVTKPEALGIIAAALDAPVQGAHTAHPFVAMPGGSRVEVDIPKFGEAPPLAIDVHDPRGEAEARTAADALLTILSIATAWPLHRLHD